MRAVGIQDYVRGKLSVTNYDLVIASPGTTSAGAIVPGGGLSGLFSTGKDSLGRLTFLAPADRGPNGGAASKDVVKADGTPGTDGTADAVQPFLLPDYQARFYKLALDEKTGVVSTLGEIKLTQKDGTTPITGRSNGKGDQIPVDANGNLLSYDPYGADLESIVQDKDGNIWMSDEYRPAVYKFNATGQLIERYVPVGAGVAAGLAAGALGKETLPAEYAKRQTNRGFEGMAYDAATNKLWAFVQSPLDDVGANDGKKSSLIRILEIDATTGNPSAEYLYSMAGKDTVSPDGSLYEAKVDKIGDVAYDAKRQVFYVLERDSAPGALSYKQVFEVSLKGATNILNNPVANEENLTIDSLLSSNNIKLASKVLITNLASIGYIPNDKPEGLALLSDGRLAVINDNDFGVTSLTGTEYTALSATEKTKYTLASDINGSKTYVYSNPALDAKIQLGIVNFTPTHIDPDDKDGGIKLLANQNIYGLRMPDGIAAYQAVGANGSAQTFTIIANEGDGRLRPDGDYTDPTTNVITKDGITYNDEFRQGVTGTGTDKRLKTIKDLGNLSTTTYEQKFSFGGRSITILDSLGNIVWDSGDLIDRAVIAAGIYDDTRSDDKGSEPENLTVATIAGRNYAFVGLERGTSSSIATFDITNPYNAYLVDFHKSSNTIISPEGLLFIPAATSPNGKDLLISSNEISKDLEVMIVKSNLPLLKSKVGGLKISEVFTIGEAFGTYIPTGTPDGMGAYLKDANTIRLLFQSEIVKTAGYEYKLANNTALTGARIHYLDIDKASNQVIGAGLAYDKVYDRSGALVTTASQISGDANTKNGFDRFCAANLIEANPFGTGKGFADRIELLGEESSSANNSLGGAMYALDVANNALHALPDLGFGSWEGATAVDTGNTNQVALILGDDYASATLGAPIYMYVGTKSTAANATFLQRNGLTGGKLYAWVATSGAALNRPSEFKGFGTSADGNWVEIATKDANKAGTTGYDAQGYKSADLLRKDADSKNAFLAARIEDLDYNPNNFKQVAFVATGNETFDGGADLLGTVYTLDVTFNGAVPAASKLKIVYDGDDAGNGSAGLRSPDNIAFSKDGFIYAQEDKAVYSTASDSKYGTEKGSIWKLDPTTGKAIRWAQIDDSIDPDGADGQALDKTDTGYLAYGWESSGLIDVSALYNHAPGTDFFANVQTHGVKGGAITDQNLVAGGQILKLESAIAKTNISYTPSTGGNPITAKFTPKSGSLEGDASFNRLAASPSFTNKNPKLDIGKTGLNFSLRIDQSSTDKTADVSVDLAPMLDGLSTTGKRLAYFVYDTPTDGSAPLATAFTYDPTKKAGARFYDLDGNGTADTANLEFIDGGHGDKDGVKNGVIVDPSTPGVVSIAAIFTATSNSLSVGDPTDSTSPAAIIVKASISSRANSVNQVGYVALNSSEGNTLTYELLRDRGTILMANLESSDAPNLSAMKLENNITLINGQKLVFFEIIDTTLEALMAKGSTIDSFGSNLRILDVTKQTDTTATASKGGNTLALNLQPDSVVASLGDLISTEMGENPILDFSALTGSIITGSVSLAREASYDSSIGFYRIQRNDGAVLDPITNTLITPGSAGYKEAALSTFNLFTGFGNLSISNGATRTDTLAEFSDAGMLAPYATVAQTGETFFSFKGANSDGMNHFRMLGSGVIGLEDVAGGFDQDFDDNIVSFNFKLKQGTVA